MNVLIDPSVASIRGAFAALRLDDRGFDQIDGSDIGFRRSWAALLLALPFIALAALAVAKATALEPKLPDVPLLAAFIGGIVQWLLGTGCLALIALVFGKRDRLKQLIACDNWITLWFLVLEAPFNLLTATGLLTPLGGIGGTLLAVYSIIIAARMLLVVLKLPLAAVIGMIIFLMLIQLSLLQLLQGMIT